MSYIYDLADTWASGGGPYTSIKMNATDNDTGSASLLMDLQVGTVSQFKVSKAGITNVRGDILPFADNGINIGSNALRINTITAATAFRLTSFGAFDWSDTFLTRRAAANLRLGAVDAAAPVAQTLSVQSVVAGTTNTAGANLTITGSQGTGNAAGGSIIFQVAPAGSSGSAQNALATALTINSAGSATFSGVITANSGVAVGANVLINTNSGQLYFGASLDVILNRDAANTLALRNGTAAQAFNLYGTYTDASNYERLRFSFPASGPATITSEAAGTGVTRPLALYSGSSYIQFNTAGNDRWYINSSGHFLTNTDNTYDIGASGANRPRDIYLGGKILTASVQAVSAGTGVIFRNNSATGVAQIDTNGSLNACYATTLPAGGTAGRGLTFSSNITNMGVFFGSGAPTLSAAKGSLYLRSDGTTTNDRMYVNTDGATAWTAVTTAS
jgi:hypothetical protein